MEKIDLIELLVLLSERCALLNETSYDVMSKNKPNAPENEALLKMRDDYEDIKHKLKAEGTCASLTSKDYMQLAVGAALILGQMDAEIERISTAKQGYSMILLPALRELIEAKPEQRPDIIAKLEEALMKSLSDSENESII